MSGPRGRSLRVYQQPPTEIKFVPVATWLPVVTVTVALVAPPLPGYAVTVIVKVSEVALFATTLDAAMYALLKVTTELLVKLVPEPVITTPMYVLGQATLS